MQHRVQKCGQMLVAVSVGHEREPYKTVEPIVMPFGMGMGIYEPMNHLFGGAVMVGRALFRRSYLSIPRLARGRYS